MASIPIKKELLAGLDVGSTTVKAAVLDPDTLDPLYYTYKRHKASPATWVCAVLRTISEKFPGSQFRLAVTGSGGTALAQEIGAFFVQEVVANSVAVTRLYSDTRVAIELGGQDAKVVFFRQDENSGTLVATDMRMNGSCAGGTGAFIDQIAELLSISADEFNLFASRGKTVYEISGRCGVFAKTDIQPLLNQGVPREDIALSSFHAIAKQTIGGLAQGLSIEPPVIFEGGPLTFNPHLVEVFRQRLGVEKNQVCVPDRPEMLIAHGAALSLTTLFASVPSEFSLQSALGRLEKSLLTQSSHTEGGQLFFRSEEEKKSFTRRHRQKKITPSPFSRGETVDCYLGIDAGSTTTKWALIDTVGEVIETYYSSNHGTPLEVIQKGLLEMNSSFLARSQTLNILGAGSTGYGEMLFAQALHCDYHSVETVAHAEAAVQYAPEASFILDIGGQDMKAISLQQGIITGIVMNEACSAGCGSFVETYAHSLGIRVEEIAEKAFSSSAPSILGSRCTVFMNSSIISEQRNGKNDSDILAGICRSIIDNVFTKVIRISNIESLGKVIVAQGGTFRNDAVLRAFEQFIEKNSDAKIIRPPRPGEMGAIGVALLTKKHIEKIREYDPGYTSSFIGMENLETFSYTSRSGVICKLCSNSCRRTIVDFNDGSRYVTGNRCPRGELTEKEAALKVRKRIRDNYKRSAPVPDMVRLQRELLVREYPAPLLTEKRGITIGIPRVLEFWNSLPFWHRFFTALGFDVVISSESSYTMLEEGLPSVTSDTVCLPAKIVHGHIQELIRKKVDRIFMPMMIRIPKMNRTADGSHVCSVVQGYPMVIEKSDNPAEMHGIPFDTPVFHWYDNRHRIKQTVRHFSETFAIPRSTVLRAVREGDKALGEYRRVLKREGAAVLESLGTEYPFGVVLAARPYHSDPLINHNISSYFTSRGIPVLVLDSLPHLHHQDLSRIRIDTTIPNHTKMIEGTLCAAKNPRLEVVNLVSFGCGHDGVISDEISRILRETAGKEPLILKMDEGDVQGPLTIRINSFIETVKMKRDKELKNDSPKRFTELNEAFITKFLRRDKTRRTVLTPNLSPAFSTIISAVMRHEGFKVIQMPLADEEAIELGKRYVHNDVCYPAQVNIGEALKYLKSGMVDPGSAAVGFAKNCEDCRAGQYAALARKALDDAGFPQVPIVTTGRDIKNMHPGARFSPFFQLQMAWGLILMDSLEMMKRAVRPYETTPGETERIFNRYLNDIADVLTKSHSRCLELLDQAVTAFNSIPVRREKRSPRIGLVGEIFLNHHPVSNRYIENYLEENGIEVAVPPMLDFFRRVFQIEINKAKRKLLPYPVVNMVISGLTDTIVGRIRDKADRVLSRFASPHHTSSIKDLIHNIEGMIDISYVVGEGWLIPAEIIEMIKEGIRSFVMVQPFGCLPNHITGRGMIKAIKEKYPDVQILSLDFDPDMSAANIENRLQMLIMTTREREKKGGKGFARAC